MFLDLVGFLIPTISVPKQFDCTITIHKHPLSEFLDPVKVSMFLFVPKKKKQIRNIFKI